MSEKLSELHVSGWDSQDVSGGSISSSPHLRDHSALWPLINLLGLCLCRQGGSGAGSPPDVAQPDSELVPRSKDKLQRPAGLGWSALVWWMASSEELSLFVCLHNNKTVRLSTVSTLKFWPQPMSACVSDASVAAGNVKCWENSRNTGHAD